MLRSSRTVLRHHGVIARDNEGIKAGRLICQGEPDCLRGIASVDIVPKAVRMPSHIELNEALIIFLMRHPGEAQRNELHRRLPARELLRHMLLEKLDHSIGCRRLEWRIFVDRQRRQRSERRPVNRLARGENDIVNTGRRAAANTLCVA